MRRGSALPAALDCEAIAQALLTHCERPTMVFDRHGLLRGANAPAEELIGTANAIAGRPWEALFERSPLGLPLPELFAKLLRGDQNEWVVASGTWSLRCRAAVVKGGGAVVITAREWWRGPYRETSYEISVSPESFGRIVGSKNAALVGRTCHDALWARSVPCEQCPASDLATSHCVMVWASEHSLDVVSAAHASEHTASIQIQRLDAEATQLILAARRARLAAQHGLSPREREVLDLLSLGRTTHEIATALAITLRTAKYHQSNVLTKLGLDSRLELLRLLA